MVRRASSVSRSLLPPLRPGLYRTSGLSNIGGFSLVTTVSGGACPGCQKQAQKCPARSNEAVRQRIPQKPDNRWLRQEQSSKVPNELEKCSVIDITGYSFVRRTCGLIPEPSYLRIPGKVQGNSWGPISTGQR